MNLFVSAPTTSKGTNKISQLQDHIPRFKVGHVPRQLIEKYVCKSITLTASPELVHFSNVYKSGAFHSEDLYHYCYFSLQTNSVARPR